MRALSLKTVLILLSAVLISCTTIGRFTVTGQLTGSNRDSLVIEEMDGQSMMPIMTILTDENGGFTFSDTASNPRLLFIRTPDNEYMSLLVMDGQDITIEATKGSINTTFKVEGSHESQLVRDINQQFIQATYVVDSLGQKFQTLKDMPNKQAEQQQLQMAFSKIMMDQRTFIRSFIEEHYESPACLLALSHRVSSQQVLNPAEDFDLFLMVDSSLFKKYPESPMILNLHQYIKSYQDQLKASGSASQGSKIGTIAPEINLPSPEGSEIALSSLRGKYVLLDFWAAWCGPCRRENPNLVKAYEEYHDKGFEIYQVSLDRKKEDWVGAIAKDRLNWIHVSDLKYWNSVAAKLYGVQSIPASYLLDPSGKIIAQNLRGPALDAKLKELLK